MKVFLDSADITAIKKAFEYYPLDGVTTNPSILAAAGRAPYDVLQEIRDFLGAEGALHVQVISREANAIVEEAHSIQRKLGQNTYVKIPVTAEGVKAIKQLVQEGAHVTATGIYTVAQAFWAGKAGAAYAAPYVNRIDNLGAEGIRTVCRMQDCFTKYGFTTDLLAASFKNSQQVLSLAEYGIGSFTVMPDILNGMLKNAAVDAALDTFTSDFEKLCGAGATMNS